MPNWHSVSACRPPLAGGACGRWRSRGLSKAIGLKLTAKRWGLDVLAFVRLDAERNRGDITRQLEEAILKIPEVISCHYISGTGTFELQVVSKDLNTFSQFARDVLINLPNVKDLHTSFSLGEVKAAGALPLKP